MSTAYRFPDYQVAGTGDTTVFLLHGAYGAKDYFRYEIETLVRSGLRVVAWDAPGYGISPLPKGGLSIEGLAETVGCLMDREASATNIVLGHSMGGITAPAVYAARPEKVHGVVISATLGSFAQKSPEDQKTFLAERVEPLRAGNTFRDTAGKVIDSMFAPGSKGPMVELVREVALGTHADTFCAAITAITLYDGEPNLKRLCVPTLLLAGEHDKVGRPEGMKNLQTQFMPHAEYACIPDAGHYAFAEQHDLFNAHLLRFIRERVMSSR
ncbi:alpha/beta fold hydrolase [Comamonas testosteroni]|uniref:alpha/beta fold hydrolase n=1 Tax=Comamonas testosteroni TaxID=285 RepID=UPI0005B4902B|nr:alpha/beta hydrolase [Comamonas testosteroni]